MTQTHNPPFSTPLASLVGSESAPHFNMSLWSWVRALTEAKEKGMGHAPIACEWDYPSSEWARGWGPYIDGVTYRPVVESP